MRIALTALLAVVFSSLCRGSQPETATAPQGGSACTVIRATSRTASLNAEARPYVEPIFLTDPTGNGRFALIGLPSFVYLPSQPTARPVRILGIESVGLDSVRAIDAIGDNGWDQILAARVTASDTTLLLGVGSPATGSAHVTKFALARLSAEDRRIDLLPSGSAQVSVAREQRAHLDFGDDLLLVSSAPVASGLSGLSVFAVSPNGLRDVGFLAASAPISQLSAVVRGNVVFIAFVTMGSSATRAGRLFVVEYSPAVQKFGNPHEITNASEVALSAQLYLLPPSRLGVAWLTRQRTADASTVALLRFQEFDSLQLLNDFARLQMPGQLTDYRIGVLDRRVFALVSGSDIGGNSLSLWLPSSSTTDPLWRRETRMPQAPLAIATIGDELLFAAASPLQTVGGIVPSVELGRVSLRCHNGRGR